MSLDDEAVDVERRLRAFLTSRLPEARDLQLTLHRRSSVGNARENWAFDAEWVSEGQHEQRNLLLRRDLLGSVTTTDRESEYGVLRAVEPIPVPAPRVHWLDATGEHLGLPSIVMDRVEGAVDGNVLTEQNALGLDVEARLRLARRYCEILAEIHRPDPADLDLGPAFEPPTGNAAEATLASWADMAAREALEPQPEIAEVVCWLEDHLPETQRLALVHGDYRPENSIVVDGDVAAILDWELAHVGDPLEDLGYYGMPFLAGQHFVPGKWELADFCTYYEQLTGTTVDQEALRFWQVLSTMKVLVFMMTGNRAVVEGRRVQARGGVFIRRVTSLLLQMIGI